MRYLAELATQNEAARELLKHFIPDHVNKDAVLSALGVGSIVQEKKTFTQLFSLVEVVINEVSSEKQRKWACAQMGSSRKNFKGKPSLSSKEAKEMCKSEVEEDLEEMSSMAGGNVQGHSGFEDDEIQGLIREDDIVEEVVNYLLNMQ